MASHLVGVGVGDALEDGGKHFVLLGARDRDDSRVSLSRQLDLA